MNLKRHVTYRSAIEEDLEDDEDEREVNPAEGVDEDEKDELDGEADDK
ncbi:hypothetical protein EVJ58_g5284 [Rhodofomes roseus]|uniref:Uncharacterized protein n=1 Tax=Rhodofomes roseus TaxID=34475 RepID=A0A4Y9YCI7_9APHY|nr:hypothetical protein EVJ58_g5284 [Rhodofomes roseus]